MKFWIRYGLSGGFGGCGDWEEIDATDEDEANTEAWHRACEEYESYEGMHGLRTIEDIMEEDELDEDEAEDHWREERESWIEYEVSATKPEDFEQ